MQLTPFGLCVRKLRLEVGCRLKDMADHIGCSSAYLSAIEVGKRPITDEVATKTITFFQSRGLNECRKIQEAVDQSRNAVNVDQLDFTERSMLAAFARRIPEAAPQKRAEMLKKLESLLIED